MNQPGKAANQPGGQAAPAAVVPSDAALAEAVKALADAMKNEETRFSNVNARAVALLSATSLVTAIVGFFAKDLSDASVAKAARHVGIVGLTVTLVLLVITAGVLVFGTLLPAKRFLFGDNGITAPDPTLDLLGMQRVEYLEYRQIMNDLQERIATKILALKAAYCLFFVTVFAIALTASIVDFKKW